MSKKSDSIRQGIKAVLDSGRPELMPMHIGRDELEALCDSHDTLLEACKVALVEYDKTLQWLPNYHPILHKVSTEAEQLRAAITKAESETK